MLVSECAQHKGESRLRPDHVHVIYITQALIFSMGIANTIEGKLLRVCVKVGAERSPCGGIDSSVPLCTTID